MSIFSVNPRQRVKSNKFDLSHERKMSLNMGDLVPVMLTEVMPGDHFRVSSENLLRLAPMIAPMMHRVNVFTHFFFVPNRLVWSEWEDFITGGRDGLASPVLPALNYDANHKVNYTQGSLADYLGIPHIDPAIGVSVQPLTINALPFRAYQLIFNEYYQDQNLSQPVETNKTSGLLTEAEQTSVTSMRKRCWEKDYFTSALPWAQRGGEVLLPMEADINYLPTSFVKNGDGTDVTTAQQLGITPDAGGAFLSGDSATPTYTKRIENIDTIENASTTINDLRKAVRLQEWLERTARAGSRYIEQIFAHFDVISSDARLQRPEYLGGGKQPIVISEVLNTAGPLDDQQTILAPQGNMSGHGISVGNTNRFQRRFEEHGYIIGIMSILPRTAYQQGLERHWFRTNKFDYPWPEFANLGEQEVLNKELYVSHDDSLNNVTFGYQSRYAEMKYKLSTVHGDFRGNLDHWHLGRTFTARPNLNETFVSSQDISHRIFAVEDPTLHKVYAQIYNNVSVLRKLPYYGTPML